jgi:hypothetical protein
MNKVFVITVRSATSFMIKARNYRYSSKNTTITRTASNYKPTHREFINWSQRHLSQESYRDKKIRASDPKRLPEDSSSLLRLLMKT